MTSRKSPPLRIWRRLPAAFGVQLETENGRALAHVWKGQDGLWRGSSSSANSIIYGPYGSEQEARSAMWERV